MKMNLLLSIIYFVININYTHVNSNGKMYNYYTSVVINIPTISNIFYNILY